MADEFKPGDVVQLNSGGPLMTVIEQNSKKVLTAWFSADTLMGDTFVPAALRVVDAPPAPRKVTVSKPIGMR